MDINKDIGHQETESVLTELEKRISAEYAQAEKEITEKLNEYLEKFEEKDALKLQALADGKITQAEYDAWRVGQIATGEKWEAMRDSIAADLANTSEIAKSISTGYMPEVYAINFNYGTFQVESLSKVDTGFTLYNRQAVESLFDDNKTLYHAAGKKTQAAINMGKQIAWDKKQVQSVMTQSLLQGESIGKIATRLSKAVGDSDRKAAIRNARTMTTGVENSARVDSYKRAENMGIEMEQEWVAALDDRTRHEHRILNGQRVKVGESFEVEGYRIRYPADPLAEDFLVYNCRCALIAAMKGHEVKTNDWSEEKYNEWKEGKSTSDSITKQDEIEKKMKAAYSAEYRSYKR